MKVFIWVVVAFVYTMFVIRGEVDYIDAWFYNSFTGNIHPMVENILIGITYLADTKMLAVLSVTTVIILWRNNKIKWILLYIGVMSGGVIITLFMKLGIQRERPGGEISNIDFWGLGGDLISYSYPSGHAVKSLLFFMFWVIYLQRNALKGNIQKLVIILFVTLPIMVGIGQIILARHYVSDVFGGYSIAIAWLLVCRYIFSRVPIKTLAKSELNSA